MYRPTHRPSRRLHLWVLAGYLLVQAVAALSPWLGDAPLAPLCRGSTGSSWVAATPAGGGPDGDTLDCAACLPLQLSATEVPMVRALTQAPGPWLQRPHPPFTDPLRVALPPARGPPSA